MKKSLTLCTLIVSLVAVAFTTPVAFAQCTTPFASQPSTPSGDEVFIDDSLPSGANVTSGSVNWDTNQYATGSQSFYLNGAGTNTVRIDDLGQIFRYGNGKAIVYVLIDPCNPTSEIKITWSSNYRTATAYWGSNLIGNTPYGSTVFNRGALPSTGGWARLEVPIGTHLGLRGHELDWMQIETYNGRVWFDHIGQDGVGCLASTASAPSIPSGATVWIDDSIPSGATLDYGFWWSDQKASGTQSLAYFYMAQTSTSVVKVSNMSQATASGDNLILYVMRTGCADLKELKITWYSGSTEGSVYYGTVGVPAIGGESSSVFMGSTVPAADTWTRIEIPAATVGLDGA
nr:hypothetical protein [Acidobacteriota bacterium]